LLLAASGCRKLLGPPEGDAGAIPTVTTAAPAAKRLTPRFGDSNLWFAELATANVYFQVWGMHMSGVSYEARFTGFPAGTTVEIGGKTTALPPGDYSELIDIGDIVAALAPADALNPAVKVDPHIDIKIRTPGYDPFTFRAPKRSVDAAVPYVMSQAIRHPVLFKHESVSDPPPAVHSVLYTGHKPEIYGPAATLRDVDWIAVVVETAVRKEKECPTDEIPASGRHIKPRVATLEFVDNEVLIVERKTSKIITRKTFHAEEADCPSHIDTRWQTVSPGELPMKRWVRDELAAH
jgi:hypothetical protein